MNEIFVYSYAPIVNTPDERLQSLVNTFWNFTEIGQWISEYAISKRASIIKEEMSVLVLFYATLTEEDNMLYMIKFGKTYE